ncbi:MAG: histidine kinase [Treponemataceae bacterium]|nr:histidine kinase [Treponemataceae bacterium]
MGFTRRLVLVYTCILVIPLFAAVLFGTGIYRNSSFESLYETSASQVHDYADHIFQSYVTITEVETAITSDENFTMALLRPDTLSDIALIQTVVDEVTYLSRLDTVLPEVYTIRIFCDNPGVPERWPFILQSSRENLASLPRFSYNYVADYLGNQLWYHDESMCYTKPMVHRKPQVGYLQVSLRMSDLFPQLYTLREPDNAPLHIQTRTADYVFRITREGTIMGSVTDGGTPSVYPELSQDYLDRISSVVRQSSQNQGAQIIHVGRESKILTWEKVPKMDLLVVQLNSTEQLDTRVLLFRVGVFLALTLIIIIFAMIIRYVTSRMLDRVYNVMDGLRQVSQGNMDVTLTVDGTDEVAETQRAFNTMTEQLRSQIQTIKEEQSLLADTEIKAMQNQINAHFLYNVLETIKMQAVLKDQDDISESLTVLGKMMRYCLRWRIHRVTVQQEIDYICSYVYILNLRNDYLITLNLEIPPECECIEIPKMVLQPVIENAFTYAIEPQAQDAEITVSARLEGETLWLCVRDYGDGISAEKLAGIRSYLADKTYERDTKGSIGLKNIQQRLYMFYGEEYSIQIESQSGWGTEIRIPVPAVKGV